MTMNVIFTSSYEELQAELREMKEQKKRLERTLLHAVDVIDAYEMQVNRSDYSVVELNGIGQSLIQRECPAQITEILTADDVETYAGMDTAALINRRFDSHLS